MTSEQRPRQRLRFASIAWTFAAALALLATSNAEGRIGKVSIAGGYYSLSANAASRSSSVSSVGLLHGAFQYPVYPQVELAVGYTLVTAHTFTGDLGFGFDAAAYYYPFTTAGSIEADHADYRMKIDPVWRPFVGAALVQKLFESSKAATSANYLGGAFLAGTEYALRGPWSLRGELRYLRLWQGSSSSKISEIEFLAGVCFSL